MIRRVLFAAPLLLALAGGRAHALGKPAWVKKRPSSGAEFIGIGWVNKKGTGPRYEESARDRAFSDLVSQVSAGFENEFLDTAARRSGLNAEDILVEVRRILKSNISGHDCSTCWENRKEYWVQCRLSKEALAASERDRLQEILGPALDGFIKARSAQSKGDFASALKLYVQTLILIQDFPGQPLETPYGGAVIRLGDETYASLKNLVSGITLRPDKDTIDGKSGRALATPAYVTAIMGKTGVTGLPLRCRFSSGGGLLTEEMTTGRGGRTVCRVLKIQSEESRQVLEIFLDPQDLDGGKSPSLILRETLRRLSLPKTEITLAVRGLKLFLEVYETNLQENLDTPFLEPILRKTLEENGYTVTDVETEAELVVKLGAHSREGTTTSGTASAYVDASLKLVDRGSGEEIFQGMIQDVKGMDSAQKAAGLMALAAAKDRLETNLLPLLVERLDAWKNR